MSLKEEWIQYGEDRQFTGFQASMARAKGAVPAIIVIQEIWGVDDHIQDLTRRFAQSGYVAFAPDLYAKDGERPAALTAERVDEAKRFLDSLPPTAWGNLEQRSAELGKRAQDERERISETLQSLFGGVKSDSHVNQLLAAAEYLRNTCEYSNGQGVASVGFCMGGALSALLAAGDSELRGAVIFYGHPPGAELIQQINCPVLGFYAELDQRITGQLPSFDKEMKAAGKKFESHIYQGARHAFFNDTRSSYDAAAARDAFAKTLLFFNKAMQQ